VSSLRVKPNNDDLAVVLTLDLGHQSLKGSCRSGVSLVWHAASFVPLRVLIDYVHTKLSNKTVQAWSRLSVKQRGLLGRRPCIVQTLDGYQEITPGSRKCNIG
jgi:hypothetical protein